MIFCACSTKIPTTEELQSKTHIPQAFENLSTTDANNTQTRQKRTLQESTPIERFYALFDDAQLHTLLDIAL